MDELHQRTPRGRPFQGAPIDVVAKVSPGVARQPHRHFACPDRAHELDEWCTAGERLWSAKLDNALRRAVSACIRKQHRHGVTCPCFDADLAPAASESEHEHDVRLLREELWQAAIDCRVARSKYGGCAMKPGEGRAPTVDERFRQNAGWGDRRA